MIGAPDPFNNSTKKFIHFFCIKAYKNSPKYTFMSYPKKIVIKYLALE